MRPGFLVILAFIFTAFNSTIINIEQALSQTETYTYKLTQSNSSYQFWTTPTSNRVFKDDPIPPATGTGIKVYAARNEFEPFQLVVNPVLPGNVTISIGTFGTGITTEIYQVKYVTITQKSDNLGRLGDYPDPLYPLSNGEMVSITSGENTAFWFNVQVSPTTTPGDYTTNVTIGPTDIPVTLHVFNFTISDTLHVLSQMNFNHQAVLTKYSVPGTGVEYWMYVDKMKQCFLDHRLTPKSPLWSGGVTSGGGAPYIDYYCDTNILQDNDGIWGFEEPARMYLDGAALDSSTGFPSFMAATFLNNDPSIEQRGNLYCSNDLTTIFSSGWMENFPFLDPFNQEWFYDYIPALETYLTSTGYLSKAYYYLANEPQDTADYDAVAWFSQELKRAAPGLKLMVSEEPRPEIYNNPGYLGAKVDIWLPVLQNYDPTESHDRELNHNETTWIYFLHSTRPPYFNPITLDHPGIESKLTGWFLWKYRIKGIAYYSMNNWNLNPWTDPLMGTSHNGDKFMLYPPAMDNTNIPYGSNNHRFVPSIRFELMRDSLEDYEYLYILNGNKQPQMGIRTSADIVVDKIIAGLTSYTRDSEFMYNLRRLIGLKNGNEIPVIPDIDPPARHPRAQGSPGYYYINFQDPLGSPLSDPLIVNGHEYMKIGYEDYDQSNGYGWYSPPDVHWMTRYISSGPNELQKSILFSDWGRPTTFEFDLPAGSYNVTVSVGWEGRTYLHHKIDVEGVNFINDEPTTPSSPYIVRIKQVTVDDYKLTMNMGIFNEYTMLNYIDIETVGGTILTPCDCTPLPPPGPGETIVTVSNLAELQNAISVASGPTTIYLNNGTYYVTSSSLVNVYNPDITIRSVTGNRNDVIIQGEGMGAAGIGHGIYVDADNVTIADLTVREVQNHAFFVTPGTDNVLFHNVRGLDTGEQVFKASGGISLPPKNNGIIQCSTFEYTTTLDEGNYTNGIDILNSHNWIIRDNVIRNIKAQPGAGLAGPAILAWQGCSGTIVERNLIIDCDFGISFGNAGGSGVQHTGGIIRNNFIKGYANSDFGIGIIRSVDAKVINNTIYSPGSWTWSIEARFPETTNCLIINNLADEPIWDNRDGASSTLATNITTADSSYFMDVISGDLHLSSPSLPAIDTGTSTIDRTMDIDCADVVGVPDIGADEYDGITVGHIDGKNIIKLVMLLSILMIVVLKLKNILK